MNPDQSNGRVAPVEEICAEPHMASAGAELMALSHRLQKSEGFTPEEAERVREIGAWISVGRQSDLERSLIQVVGAIITGMRSRGFAFDDNAPIASQFLRFIDDLPKPGSSHPTKESCDG